MERCAATGAQTEGKEMGIAFPERAGRTGVGQHHRRIPLQPATEEQMVLVRGRKAHRAVHVHAPKPGRLRHLHGPRKGSVPELVGEEILVQMGRGGALVVHFGTYSHQGKRGARGDNDVQPILVLYGRVGTRIDDASTICASRSRLVM